MDNLKFLNTLLKSTKEKKVQWDILAEKFYSKITNVWNGIVRAYYIDYKENNKIVIYQYKTFSEEFESENISYFISICDKDFKYIYEFSEDDFQPKQADLFRLYKLIERNASGVDDIIKSFIDDFSLE